MVFEVCQNHTFSPFIRLLDLRHEWSICMVLVAHLVLKPNHTNIVAVN